MDVSRRCRTAEVTVRGESENNVDAAVDLNICSDVRDLQKVERAMQHARHLVEVQQMSCHACYLEILPGPLFNSSLLSGIRRFVATFGNTYFHAAGTCPMGTVSKKSEDSLPINGVVDEYLRVVGVEGLRVADASIVPLNGLPNAPIQSLCMTIGLKAAKLIQNLSD